MPFLHWISAEPESSVLNQPVFGTHGLVEYYPGNVNLIISVPHGGEMKPPFIPDRVKQVVTTPVSNRKEVEAVSNENLAKKEVEDHDDDTSNRITFAADIWTQEIAKVLMKEYNTLTGKNPYLVMANLHRSKMDPNRPVGQAAQGNELSQMVYREYHGFLAAARADIGGPGLLIDLHGQNHHQNSVEIGYLYKKSELNRGDYFSSVPGIRSLLERSGLTPASLLLGEMSMGALLERSGYRAVPSPRQTCPGEDRYYKGGYICQTHGSRDTEICANGIDAIQIEVPAEIRHEGGEKLRTKFSKDFAKILSVFMDTYYS